MPVGKVETIICAEGLAARFATPRLPIRPCDTGDLPSSLVAANLAKSAAHHGWAALPFTWSYSRR